MVSPTIRIFASKNCKQMKHILTTLFVLMLTAPTLWAQDKHSETYIRQRIDAIYDNLVHWTTEEDIEMPEFLPNPDSLYCTTRYNTLMAQALNCLGEEDILFDYDYWICGQDVNRDFRHQIEKVRDITPTTAVVELKVINFDEHDVVLTLIFERGDWYIDDFNGENQPYFQTIINEKGD